MKATRADAYADERNWHDTGCEVAPGCLACPLPRCRYDYAGGVRALQNLTRDDEIRQRLDAGETTTAVAAHFGVTRRTVFRVRTKHRPQDYNPQERARDPRGGALVDWAETLLSARPTVSGGGA